MPCTPSPERSNSFQNRPIRAWDRPGLRGTWLLAILIASSVWTGAAGGAIASAQDHWSTPYPGVRQLVRRASGPRDVWVQEIDLCAAGISLRATRESEHRATVPSWAGGSGVEIAVNADFFSYDTYLGSGAAMGNGVAWGNADSRGEGFVAFGRDRLLLSPDGDVIDPLPSWMREVVGGKPLILRDGEVIDHGTRELCTVRHPRTALGLSRDRQTLLLFVVDGRSSRSIGMTCAEEATMLRDLGAWNAINLDGGGSSTMWVRGDGVLNVPSDGSPRVVANHLGVNATGSGIPGSCMPYEPEEDELAAGALGTTSSDLDGDGRADLCARAGAGIRCALASGAPFGEVLEGPALADDSGWSDPTNFTTIVMGDVTGDGLADLCARANAGMRCWPSTGTGFGAAIVGPTLSDDSGWGAPEHYGTIRLADVDADGDDDLCARAGAGLRCWPSNGAGFDEAWPVLAPLSDDAGFEAPSRWSTIRMGDVTGDGLADACARTGDGMRCWASTGVGFDPDVIEGPAWSDTHGWGAHQHYATIRMADVDGDGREDLCARSATGLSCHRSSGAGFEAAITLEALSDESGWDDLSNYATIAMPDLDGDGDRDVCARADARVFCWPFEGDRFGARIDGPALSDEGSWSRAIYWRSIRFADVDGDGDDDLVARGASGVRVWPSRGAGFDDALEGPAWSDAHGWWAPRFHSTLRLASDRRAHGTPTDPGDPDAGGSPDAGGPADAGLSVARDAGPTHGPDAGTMGGGRDVAGPGGISSGCSARRGRSSEGAVELAGRVALLAAMRRRRARGV
ncbi:MAG: phosphodiester glycosidase family protein [Sandaracinaceae bacterium]|nr:phosphodiester glycosidase family protein [Sandaracinaceae bacterium]